jgi:hypothetical protein
LDLSTGEVGLLRLSSDAIPRANLPTGTEAKIINPQAHDEGAGRSFSSKKPLNLNELISKFLIEGSQETRFIFHAITKTLGGDAFKKDSYINENHFAHVITHGLLNGLSVSEAEEQILPQKNDETFDRSFKGELRMQVAEPILYYMGIMNGFAEKRTQQLGSQKQPPSIDKLYTAQMAAYHAQIANLANMLFQHLSLDKDFHSESNAKTITRKLMTIQINNSKLSQKLDQNDSIQAKNDSEDAYSCLSDPEKKKIFESLKKTGNINNPWYQDILHAESPQALDFSELKPLSIDEVERIAKWTKYVGEELFSIKNPNVINYDIHQSIEKPKLSLDEINNANFKLNNNRVILLPEKPIISYRTFLAS